jgi:hypothetical protein
MNLLVVSMLISAGVGGVIASFKGRSPALWMSLGLCTGPIAVALVLCLSNRKEGKLSKQPAPTPPVPPRSIVEEIHGLAEMRERGIINDNEFAQGKVQILAWPVSSPIPPTLTPQRVWADGRRMRVSPKARTLRCQDYKSVVLEP